MDEYLDADAADDGLSAHASDAWDENENADEFEEGAGYDEATDDEADVLAETADELVDEASLHQPRGDARSITCIGNRPIPSIRWRF